MSNLESTLEVSVIGTQDQRLLKQYLQALTTVAIATLSSGTALPLAILGIITSKITVPDKQLFMLGNCVFQT